MNNTRPYTIIGAGGHARVVIDSLKSNGEIVHAVIDLEYKGGNESIMGVSVRGGYKTLAQQFDIEKVFLALAVGNNKKREVIFKELKSLGYKIPTISHSTAVICSTVVIEEGCFIGAGAIINAVSKIGSNTIINTGSIIEHEAVIGSHAHIAPGVNMAGRVIVGDRVFIGIGSTIIDYIRIGNDATIGAGSVVIANVSKGRTVAGTPAKEI